MDGMGERAATHGKASHYTKLSGLWFFTKVQLPTASAPLLAAITSNEVRSGRGYESFLQGILGTRNLVHYLFRHSLNDIALSRIPGRIIENFPFKSSLLSVAFARCAGSVIYASSCDTALRIVS
jgi:hypothetical protein